MEPAPDDTENSARAPHPRLGDLWHEKDAESRYTCGELCAPQHTACVLYSVYTFIHNSKPSKSSWVGRELK